MARTGLARALSKLGFCSRSQAVLMIQSGKVSLNGRVCRDPEKPVLLEEDQVTVDGQSVRAPEHRYLMLNKPRGLVTTASDEQGRDTVFSCFEGASLPHLGPVGRLDKASEGLLLFTDPATHLPKTYHVQVGGLVDAALLARLKAGAVDQGERLELRAIQVLRQGEKNTWLEITLDEGKNRHIRRVVEAHGLEVLRLFRVSIGSLELGKLAKGSWRELTKDEIQALAKPGDLKR
jgi:23S rRNA pseudouridine2605 synthase